MKTQKQYFQQKYCVLSTLAIALLLVWPALGQSPEPTFSSTADRLTADPGEVITFTILEDRNGARVERRRLAIDGYFLDWGAGEHEWVATPGTHVLRHYLRWIEPNGDRVNRQHYVIVQVSGWEKEGGYNHPGLTLSEDELDTIRANVRGQTYHPMQDGAGHLRWDRGYQHFAVETLDMHDHHTGRDHAAKRGWNRDGGMVWRLALKWAIEGDEAAADKAVEIMMAWANTCNLMMREDTDVYQFLHLTHAINGWLEGAEILKHYHGGYDGWSQEDRDTYDNQYVRKHLVPLSLGWQGNIGSPFGTQNQPLNVAKARIMLGIYLDDETLFQDGYDHLFEPRLYNNQYEELFGHNPISLMELTISPTGEYMEINRDPGHMGMCVHTTQTCAEILWHQGIDMYGMKIHEDETPRLLLGLEWLTRAAYGGAPSTREGNVKLGQGRIGDYEAMYNHYHHRMNDQYPLPQRFVGHVMTQREARRGNRRTLTHADLSENQPAQD